MIRKSGYRFSEKIMPIKDLERQSLRPETIGVRGNLANAAARPPAAHPRGTLMLKALTAAAALMTAWMGAASAQDVEKGAVSFKKCGICHKIGPGATNLVGPVLNGLDGRHSGSVAGFSYSDANKNSGIVWNEETFAEYIKDPRAKIPGTKMIFAGIKNEQEIKDLWAYIKQFDAEGNIKK
jgi:cytochrome c